MLKLPFVLLIAVLVCSIKAQEDYTADPDPGTTTVFPGYKINFPQIRFPNFPNINIPNIEIPPITIPKIEIPNIPDTADDIMESSNGDNSHSVSSIVVTSSSNSGSHGTLVTNINGKITKQTW